MKAFLKRMKNPSYFSAIVKVGSLQSLQFSPPSLTS